MALDVVLTLRDGGPDNQGVRSSSILADRIFAGSA